MRQKPHRSHLNKEVYPYAENPVFDHEIEDGEIFEFGNMKIRCVLPPGHSAGVLSFFFDVKNNGKKLIWNEPVVVHLGNHPYNNRTIEKRKKQLQEGSNPFIAPDSWDTEQFL